MASRVPKLCTNQKKLNGLMYLKKAKEACADFRYPEAYENFVNYFESLSDPTLSSAAVQTAFTKLVCKIGIVLEETDNIEELLKCYLQALNLFPNNYIILNNLGAYMFKVGEVDIARRYLELAVKVNKNYLPAEKNLMHCKWHQIPRWHFRMLNDKKRNLAYNKAISQAIAEGYRDITDVGAGCGLLSLIASRNGVNSLTAIEENKSLYKLCLDIFKENNFTNINTLNCLSSNLTRENVSELPEKCNLIVTEVFDVAFFGERALESIFHALAVICTDDDCRMVPCGAKLYVTGIHCDELARNHWYMPSSILNVLNLENICVRRRNPDPYDAEHLSGKNVEYLTDTQELFNIDLYDIEEICTLIRNHHNKTVKLKCKAGIVHALAVWFDLNLNEEITLTTNPFSEDRVSCWEQAVFYLDHPVFVHEGETLTLRVTTLDCKLKFTIVSGGTDHQECFEVSKEVISFMNDCYLMETIRDMAVKCNGVLSQVADSNVFPLFGFLMAKNNCKVHHIIKNRDDYDFFKHILMINGISLDKFLISKEKHSVVVNENPPRREFIYFFIPINTDGSLTNLALLDNQMNMSPKGIAIRVQLIYSSYIDLCNRVMDENVLDFRIAKYMNEYSGNEHPNLENLEYVTYSDPVTFMVLYQKDCQSARDVEVKQDGQINALYFWYEMDFLHGHVFSTFNSSHFKKSCFFLQEPRSVKKGDILRINLCIDGAHMKFTL